MLSIKNNIMASNAARHLSTAYDSLSRSVERLSSGLRINSAKDDAAGLAVRELIRADIAVLQQGSRNALDGISLLQTMEGAMGVIDENLIRMLELAEQAATGAYSDAQRAVMNAEFDEMADEIDRVAEAAKFNDITLLNSSTGSVSIHVGTETTIDVDKVNMTKAGLSIETGLEVDEAVWKAVMDDIDTTAMMSVSADDDVTMTIQFFNGATPEDMITFAMPATNTYTIAQLVSEINALSQDLGYAPDGTCKNYDMAAVVENDDGTFQLKFSSRLEATTDVQIKVYSDTAGDAGDITMGGTGGVNLTNILTAGVTLADATDFDEAVALGGLNILTADDALDSMDIIIAAINEKDTARASFGYKMKRLESTISVLNIQTENLMTAESRISDVDVATEMAELTRNQVLAQAGISMLSQANTIPQMALALLR
ncbi:MAG: flagellin N-terminal helical domain-containing protein [Planctomycetota bacterium]|jgi:flagellin